MAKDIFDFIEAKAHKQSNEPSPKEKDVVDSFRRIADALGKISNNQSSTAHLIADAVGNMKPAVSTKTTASSYRFTIHRRDGKYIDYIDAEIIK